MVVSERFDPVESIYRAYSDALNELDADVQMIFVLDGTFPEVRSDLAGLVESGEDIEIIELRKWYGEATALTLALPSATGNIILTLPAYMQVEPKELGLLLDGLETNDLVVGVRCRGADSRWNRFQSRIFHGLMNWISGAKYRDLGCGVRAMHRNVLDEVPVYGDLHRFLPLLADRSGLNVAEVELTQAKSDLTRRVYRPGVYIRRMLDMLTVFFLVKFTKKPLRFFGLIGGSLAAVGGVVTLWLIVERLIYDIALGGRPALMLGALLFAVGVQIIAVGLIGELIIFTHALAVKEYSIETIVSKENAAATGAAPH